MNQPYYTRESDSIEASKSIDTRRTKRVVILDTYIMRHCQKPFLNSLTDKAVFSFLIISIYYRVANVFQNNIPSSHASAVYFKAIASFLACNNQNTNIFQSKYMGYM